MKSNKVEGNKQGAVGGGSKVRSMVEGTATFGLILVAVGLIAPFTHLTDSSYVQIFKWIYAPGALIFTVARIVGATDPADSMRLRRLRRLEFWAGVSLCIGAFFWFYNEHRFAEVLSMNFGTNACLRETVYFTLVGAIIQVLCTINITRRRRKEGSGDAGK